MRLQFLQDNKPYEIMFKSIDQGRIHYQALLDKRRSYNTLCPVWRLVDAAAGKDIADAALSEPPTRAAKPAEHASPYGSKKGDISDGSCRSKTLCDTGQSRFSTANSVGACKAQCAAAFSGCTRAEVRSNVRRN